MNEKIIDMEPLSEMGSAVLHISETSVKIAVKGINGVMKAWLVGGESTPIGNIVNGIIKKEINTKNNTSVLITQSGRQLFIAKYAQEVQEHTQEKQPEEGEKELPFKIDGYSWKKIVGKKFETQNPLMKFILSNRSVYDCYKKYGCYYLGDSSKKCALALPCSEGENPLSFLGNMKITKDGYCFVCIDKNTHQFILPDDTAQ